MLLKIFTLHFRLSKNRLNLAELTREFLNGRAYIKDEHWFFRVRRGNGGFIEEQ